MQGTLEIYKHLAFTLYREAGSKGSFLALLTTRCYLQVLILGLIFTHYSSHNNVVGFYCCLVLIKCRIFPRTAYHIMGTACVCFKVQTLRLLHKNLLHICFEPFTFLPVPNWFIIPFHFPSFKRPHSSLQSPLPFSFKRPFSWLLPKIHLKLGVNRKFLS